MEAKIRTTWKRRRGPGYRAAVSLILPLTKGDIRRGRHDIRSFDFKGTEIASTTKPKNRLVPFDQAQELGLDVKNARLQLSWERQPEDKEWPWLCKYELIVPLTAGGEIRTSLGGTRVGSTRPTMVYEDGKIDTPFRDGAHARWDSEALGNLPVIVACDGKTMALPARPAEPIRLQG